MAGKKRFETFQLVVTLLFVLSGLLLVGILASIPWPESLAITMPSLMVVVLLFITIAIAFEMWQRKSRETTLTERVESLLRTPRNFKRWLRKRKDVPVGQLWGHSGGNAPYLRFLSESLRAAEDAPTIVLCQDLFTGAVELSLDGQHFRAPAWIARLATAHVFTKQWEFREVTGGQMLAFMRELEV